MKRISTLVGIISIFIAAIVIFGGVFIYQYFALKAVPDTSLNINQEQQILNKPLPLAGEPTTSNQIKGTVQTLSNGCKIMPNNLNKITDDDTADIRGGVICNFLINPSLPIYTFHLIGNEQKDIVDKIEISRGGGNVIQTIDLTMLTTYPDGSADYEVPPTVGENFFTAEDVNFDGYKDIELESYSGPGGGGWQDNFWLFDPQKDMFVYSPDLSVLTGPTIHPDTKTITATSTSDPLDYDYGTYKFNDNGKLILIHEEDQTFLGADENGNESCERDISDLVNGQMITNKKITSCVLPH